jgi:DNA-binding NarL/FixJ family response regulator
MIQVLLVEDQEIVRRGLKTLLTTKPNLKVVAEADNGKEAIAQLKTLEAIAQLPDVILMDIRMPIMDGVEATRLICQQYPDIKILVLTTFNDTHYVAEALRFGAKGYLLKDTPAEELAKAIFAIHHGYTQFGPGILEGAIASMSTTEPEQPKKPPAELFVLTAREREVLRLIAAGANNREIAQALFLSEGTVRNHISHILSQLNVSNRTQASIIANNFLDVLENPASCDVNDRS